MSNPIIYSDGTLYGAAGVFYGRISSDLAAAQQAKTRETALKVKIIDERVNLWELLAADSSGQDARSYSANPGLNPAYTQRYWSYRGAADVCVLNNGHVVRVRVDVDDRQIYIQEITDPTNASQWSGGWSLLYSGDHYGVGIAKSGASSYIVYTTKSDGLYRNNVKQWTKDGLVGITMHLDSNGENKADTLWVGRVSPGITAVGGLSDGNLLRKVDVWFTDNVTVNDPYEAEWNWVWQRSGIKTIDMPGGKIIQIASFPQYAPPTAINTGESIVVSELTDIGSVGSAGNARLIRGLPGEFGKTNLSGFEITKLSDGYYYMFYMESHVDDEYLFISNLATPIVWQRSKDSKIWSEPVHTGFTPKGIAGIVEVGNYVYFAAYRAVWRRPNVPVEYDVSNYIPSLDWESPRDNQVGSGTLRIANPNGINNAIAALNDRRVIIEPGIKAIDGQFQYGQFDDFWISAIKQVTDGNANRLEITFGNIWSRLQNPLRDVYNFIGKTVYDDWGTGNTNQPFNYFFVSGTGDAVGTAQRQLKVTGGGVVLWTGWKGYNCTFHVTCSKVPRSVVFRWIDEKNYMKVTYTGSRLQVIEVVNGVPTTIKDDPYSNPVSTLGVHARWRRIDIYVNKTSVITMLPSTYPMPHVYKPGYVGFDASGDYVITGFNFSDDEYDLSSEDLIRQALALGDYHDVIVGSAEAKQYALLWGPQTDLPTAEDGLRQLLEGEKLELIWRDGFIEVGQFKDLSPIMVLQNEIISTQELGEANRRINLAQVDGNEDTWMEVDAADTQTRGRMIQAYFDLPELLTKDDVTKRAQEEIRRGKLGQSPGGQIPLMFGLWRMDAITWINNVGVSKDVRIEGIRISINQSDKPSQREELDTSLL